MLHPPLDPDVAVAIREEWRRQKAEHPRIQPTLTLNQLPAARQVGAARTDTEFESVLEEYGSAFEFEEKVISDADGSSGLKLLVATPTDRTPSRRPGVYWIHGGGMVSGDSRGQIAVPLSWALDSGAVVVSVDYRLAPEHPHPAPVEDCYAGLLWMTDAAHELGIRADGILLAGISGGGGLAAAVALMARDRQGPTPMGQMLIYPMLDDRQQTPSSIMLDNGVAPCDRESMRVAWKAVLGDRAGTEDVSPYAAPARAADLSNLPPAFLDSGSVDTFRDEIVDYASRVWQAGGDAELHIWPGGCHSFELLAPDLKLSAAAVAARANWVGRLFARCGIERPSPPVSALD